MSDNIDSDSSAGPLEVAAATEFLKRLRQFAAQLDSADRQLFASLNTPGIAQANEDQRETKRVAAKWTPAALPTGLAAALRLNPLDVGTESPKSVIADPRDSERAD